MVSLNFPHYKTAMLSLMKQSRLKIFKRPVTRNVCNRKKPAILDEKNLNSERWAKFKNSLILCCIHTDDASCRVISCRHRDDFEWNAPPWRGEKSPVWASQKAVLRLYLNTVLPPSFCMSQLITADTHPPYKQYVIKIRL